MRSVPERACEELREIAMLVPSRSSARKPVNSKPGVVESAGPPANTETLPAPLAAPGLQIARSALVHAAWSESSASAAPNRSKAVTPSHRSVGALGKAAPPRQHVLVEHDGH